MRPPAGRATALLRGTDPWLDAGSALVAVALMAGLVGTLLPGSADRTRPGVVLAIAAAGLLCAIRDNWLAPVAAALLVAAEVRDQAPVGAWAMAGGLLFVFALRRQRLEAVAAGVLFGAAGFLADLPWPEGALDAGAISLMTLAAAAVGVGQWVQAQRRYVVAEVGRRREETERRREEVTRHVAEERLRIARDLHDSVAHHFAVVSVQTNLARAQLQKSLPEADRALQNVQAAARSALQELQLVLGVLRDEPDAARLLHDVPADLVHELVASYRQTGLAVETADQEVFSLLPVEARAAVYRVLQEALTNAHRYGDGHASVAFGTDGGRHVELTVRNAISASAVAADRGGGRGLIGMQERVGELGGSLDAGPVSGEFVVRARVPVLVPAAALALAAPVPPVDSP